ncbi:hypothetical protein [Neolewinella litorea]|uniref:Uncharacterized protein n=1 Tax=Neolewinella litorea TaxID=2562452 RepID=A0A4S4NMS9_9BACT|nr:hypothetical protein [Neolewinella litorea]THH40257.1 hypothetical protein E4021_05830 [Neolewinella litorea]
MKYRLSVVLLLLFLAHVLKGVGDTLQFHYESSPYADLGNTSFWNPEQSWKAKYASDPTGEPLRPLREKFPGSTTLFVATTDAWHLSQSLQYACIRLAVCLLAVPLLGWRGGWAYAGLYALIWVVQAAGFHLAYTWFG